MRISQLPRPSQQILEVLYQQYLQNNYHESLITYDTFGCSKRELSGPLDVLNRFELLEVCDLRREGLRYLLSAKGIDLCENSAEFKTSALLAESDMSTKDWELLNNFILEIDNLSSSVMDKKSNLKEQLVKLINEVDAESLADVLSELLCH